MRSGGIFKDDFLMLLGIWDKGSFCLLCCVYAPVALSFFIPLFSEFVSFIKNMLG